MNYKFSIIQKPRVFFEGFETGCRNPDANKLEDHNKRFDENIDKKPGLVLTSFRGLLDGLVGGKRDEKTDKIRNDAMEKAMDVFRKLPKNMQQAEFLNIWNDANNQAYQTDAQNHSEDDKKRTETRESFSEKMNKGVESLKVKNVQNGTMAGKNIQSADIPPAQSGNTTEATNECMRALTGAGVP